MITRKEERRNVWDKMRQIKISYLKGLITRNEADESSVRTLNDYLGKEPSELEKGLIKEHKERIRQAYIERNRERFINNFIGATNHYQRKVENGEMSKKEAYTLTEEGFLSAVNKYHNIDSSSDILRD